MYFILLILSFFLLRFFKTLSRVCFCCENQFIGRVFYLILVELPRFFFFFLFRVFIIIRQVSTWGFYCRANLYATVGMLGRIINWLTARETTRLRVGIRLGFRGLTKAIVIKSEQNFPKKKTNSNKLFPSKAIARNTALSKTVGFYSEHIIDSTRGSQG